MHPPLARSRPPARSRRLTNAPKQTLITETRVRRVERTQIVQPTLTSLDLTDNHIGKRGITEIAGRTPSSVVLIVILLILIHCFESCDSCAEAKSEPQAAIPLRQSLRGPGCDCTGERPEV